MRRRRLIAWSLVPVCASAAAVAISCGTSDSGSTTTGCTTSIDSGAAAWVSSNFKCVTLSKSGTNYVFNTQDVPQYDSYYFGSTDSRYEAIPSGNSGNPNKISTQNYTLTIPANPTLGTSASATAMDAVGIAVNGLLIFNNQANAPDTLANELATMDSANGHPTGSGVYHMHSEPLKITNNDAKLVGVMRDGFPIYGRLEESGAAPAYTNACTPGNAGTVTNCRPFPTQMPNFHCHATALFPSGICHYHVVTSDPYITGYYAGTAGTLSK